MHAILSGLSSIAVWLGAKAAAEWGLRVALIAAFLGVFATIWAATAALFVVLKSSLNWAGVFSAAAVQFFPSTSKVATAVGIYLGTLAALRSLDYWRLAISVAVRIK